MVWAFGEMINQSELEVLLLGYFCNVSVILLYFNITLLYSVKINCNLTALLNEKVFDVFFILVDLNSISMMSLNNCSYDTNLI